MVPNFPESPALRAVVFDYGAVLTFRPSPEQWSELAGLIGHPEKEFRRDYGLYRPEYDRGVMSAAAYWQAVARRPLDAQLLSRVIELDNRNWTRINPDMLGLSRRLRRAGVKTAILSNMEFEMLAEMRAKLPWLDEFEVQVYSCEAHMVKPELKIYEYVAAELGVRTREALFLDDKAINVEGARQAGMRALVFDAPERQAEVEELLAREGIALPAQTVAAAVSLQCE